ncbi:GCN5 family acetyltransferase [Raphidocelis subcapitata]|uniref:GCN5 family acetyltransferase n=1 Tax=Raphidocelis subcapitata TaxID=307507 RepID=A0A2V0NQK3_9CHLO|nr:GCN5 family acetyltransferase [Raphidocelis subcapitata]|eukprot:GBF87823.1 GCN5 family acetyltransferase [Raphidocelis subcapitata]
MTVSAADAVFGAAAPGHLDALAANNIAMAKETEGLDLPPAVVHKGVQAVLDGSHGAQARYFVLTHPRDGAVLAQLMITFEWSDWRAAQVWWVQSVYVPPQHRRRGYYRRLYELVREEARKKGAAGVRLYADADNATAHEAYRRLGMTSHYSVFEEMFVGY